MDLQSLLDHTANRLLSTLQSETLTTENKKLTLLCKWGCDGSSGQAQYKQVFSEDTDASDTNLFMSSMVPLRLYSDKNTPIWVNSSPSSTRYCRPIKFEFAKETKELVLKEVEEIKMQISNLKEYSTELNGKTFSVKYEMLFTMVDGKVCQIVTQTPSSSTCVICKSTPKQMNDLSKLDSRVIDEEALQFGVSPLHAKIRFMECILHISYNLSFKKWSAVTEYDKTEKQIAKKRIQQLFKEKMGLLIDMPKQGNSKVLAFLIDLTYD